MKTMSADPRQYLFSGFFPSWVYASKTIEHGVFVVQSQLLAAEGTHAVG